MSDSDLQGDDEEGTEFNNKEQLHYGLILSEIYTALKLQKPGGHFALKVFDVFTETSIHLLFILHIAYKEVYVYKPKTSRPTNSEKYVICKNFTLSDELKVDLLNNLKQLSAAIGKLKSKYISFRLFETIPEYFVNDIKHMNTDLLKKQCSFLQQAVELCQNGSFLEQYDSQLTQSIERRKQVFQEWEQIYNLNAYV
jgi:cap1 methyltransferase